MTPLALFLRTLSRTTAIVLGTALAVLHPPPAVWLPHAVPPLGAAATQSVEDLSAQLSAPDPAIRATAACELRKRGSAAAGAVDALLERLADAAPVARPVCGEKWHRSLDDTRTSPGEEAAAALVSIGSRTVDPLVARLGDPVWIARRNAAWALGALDAQRAVSALARVLEKDDEASVREQAAWALGAIGDRAATPALIKGLGDADAQVRRQSAWAAGAVGDRRAVDRLISVLRDGDPRVREQAAWALGAIGDDRARDALLPVLQDAEPAVRRQAAWAIGAIGR